MNFETGASRWSTAKNPHARHMSERLAKLRELEGRLELLASEGRIWLDGQRMVMLHGESLWLLREELISSLGQATARGLLTRIGYASGCRDAAIALNRSTGLSLSELIMTGGLLHAIQGFASAERVNDFTLDPKTGSPHFEWIWHESIEDEMHLAKHGISHESMCWLEVGYSAGFLSTCVGKRILVREVECRSKGDPHCRNVGKLASEWDDPDDDLRYFESQPLVVSTAAPDVGAGAASRQVVRTEEARPSSVLGASTAYHVIRHQILRVAPTSATVLFLGESGVGKSLFARELHQQSRRSAQPFVEVNCAAIPDTLLESELFGVVKGAYSNATASRPGRFEIADGGSLFLDEVATLSPSAQGKLLRVLQTGEFERLGSTQTVRTDVRLIAATNEDLELAVREGRFREDLYYRLKVFPIRIPPLRERRDDIPLLVESLLQRFSSRHGRNVKGVTPRGMHALLRHPWQGNVRELENVLERGLILADEGGWIDLQHLFDSHELVTTVRERTVEPLPAAGGDASDHSAHSASPSHPGTSADPADAAGAITATYSVGAGTAAAWSAHTTASPGESTAFLSAMSEPGLLAAGQPDQWLDLLAKREISLPQLEDQLLRAALERCGGNVSATARLLGLTRAQVDYRVRNLRAS